MTFTDEDIRRTKLVMNNKQEEAFDKDTLNHLNVCIEFMIIENNPELVDMLTFHFHTLGHVEYVYFIRKFLDKITKKYNNIEPYVSSTYIDNFNTAYFNNSRIVKSLYDIYNPLLRMARTMK